MKLFSFLVAFAAGAVFGFGVLASGFNLPGKQSDVVVLLDDSDYECMPADPHGNIYCVGLKFNVFGDSEIVDPSPHFENLQGKHGSWLQWLETRTRFNSNGHVIVGYDAYFSAVAEVDEVLGELASCRGEPDDLILQPARTIND